MGIYPNKKTLRSVKGENVGDNLVYKREKYSNGSGLTKLKIVSWNLLISTRALQSLVATAYLWEITSAQNDIHKTRKYYQSKTHHQVWLGFSEALSMTQQQWKSSENLCIASLKVYYDQHLLTYRHPIRKHNFQFLPNGLLKAAVGMGTSSRWIIYNRWVNESSEGLQFSLRHSAQIGRDGDSSLRLESACFPSPSGFGGVVGFFGGYANPRVNEEGKVRWFPYGRVIPDYDASCIVWEQAYKADRYASSLSTTSFQPMQRVSGYFTYSRTKRRERVQGSSKVADKVLKDSGPICVT